MALLPALAALAAAVGCELQEITVAEVEDVVVVEGLVQLGSPVGVGGTVTVLLHRTVGHQARQVPNARVRIGFPDGSEVGLMERSANECVVTGPDAGPGTCYLLLSPDLEPGMRLELTVDTPEGEHMEAATVVPDSITMIAPGPGVAACVLEPRSTLELRWTSSPGAWAYLSETEIFGLRDALGPEITVDEEPLYLLGLSVSAADTTVVFPAEFGIFDRTDLDRDLAVYLQEGLAPRTVATTSVAAVDRNYVNWVRGGNFNPSGTVRVPSVRGEGTGFFGSAFVRTFRLLVNPGPVGLPYDAPPCQ
jgi:hypothetical protein